MDKKILFVINPISGIGKKKVIEKSIDKYLNKNLFEYEIVYTKAAKHAIEISKQAAGKYDIVVAVGGDGTVNEISRGLIGTNTAMAIIPTGSGNGLARFLKIPINVKKSLQLLNNHSLKTIDSSKINDATFANVAGVGFDAHIAHLFDNYGKRGLLSYVKLIINEFVRYKDKNYRITIDGKTYDKNAFSISFANSSQFGNNAHIAPKAKIDDGLLDISILQKFSFFYAPIIAVRLFAKTIDKSRFVETFRGKEIKITTTEKLITHIDGEAVELGEELRISVLPMSLNIVVKK